MGRQDLPHRGRGDGEEVLATPKLRRVLAREAEEGLVHECGGLQRVVARLIAEIPTRQRAQLVVHERHHLGGGLVGLR